jgi:hypothetical protein
MPSHLGWFRVLLGCVGNTFVVIGYEQSFLIFDMVGTFTGWTVIRRPLVLVWIWYDPEIRELSSLRISAGLALDRLTLVEDK